MAVKVYRGKNTGMGGQQVEAAQDGELFGRRLRHVVRHSPDGFQWGYGGSGPAELARCILLDHLPASLHPLVEYLYQPFKVDFVARAGTELLITEKAINDWLWGQALVMADYPDRELVKDLDEWLREQEA